MKLSLLVASAIMAVGTMASADTFGSKCNAGCMDRAFVKGKEPLTNENLFAFTREVNREDQRLVGGWFDSSTGELTLVTEDMTKGRDGDISRREVVVDLEGLKGEDGKDGRDGVDGKDGRDGVDGKDGVDGEDGKDGRDGVDGKDGADAVFPQQAVDNAMREMEARFSQDLAASTALGGLEMRTPGEGDLTWSVGVGGISNAVGSAEAVSLGARYGISENLSGYGKVSRSLQGDSTAWFVGVEGQF